MPQLRAKIKETLSQFDAPLAQLLSEICQVPDFDATLSPEQFAMLMRETKLTESELRIALLPLAAAYAIAPISHFYVGAIVTGDSGRLYFGANMEFAEHGLNNSIHAEQSAISHAWLKGETRLTDVTINFSPCGHCRQFINELNQAELLEIQLPNQAAQKLSYYLPNAFGPADLNIAQRLMKPDNHGFSQASTDQAQQTALDALNQSYAPYSQQYSAVVLSTKDGEHYVGRYAENAAFNPSLAPLQMALNSLNLANKPLSAISAALLIETKQSLISHAANTKALLHSLNSELVLKHIQI